MASPLYHAPRAAAAGQPSHHAFQRLMREPLTSTVTPGASSACRRRDQGIDIGKPFGARAEGLDRARALRADGEQALHAAIARVAAHVRMAVGWCARRAPPCRRAPARWRRTTRAQHLQARAHRAGIGVVGIVDDPAVAQTRLQLQPAGHRRENPRALLRCLERRAGGARGGGGRQRIQMLCAPPAFSLMGALPRGTPDEARGELACSMACTAFFGREIGGGVHAEGDHAPRFGDAAPVAGVRVVGIDDRGADRPRPATISPSPLATPSRSPKPSRCSAPALVMRPTVGRASAPARRRRRCDSRPSPPRRCDANDSRRISVSGTPM
jgi:hypothetical protein